MSLSEASINSDQRLVRPTDAKSRRTRRILIVSGCVFAVLAFVALVVLVCPIPIDPIGATAEPLPPLTGMYAPNTRLEQVDLLGLRGALGPEDIAFDELALYTGVADGRILRLHSDASELETFATTGGRPLGVRFDSFGHLIVANATSVCFRWTGTAQLLS